MIKSNNTASVSSLCCTNTRHFPEAPLLPEQEGSAGNYTPDELRNAEEMLADLDEVYYSLIKLQREYGALVRASGPDGYVCHSAECSRSAQSLNMSALELAQRLECLSSRYHALVYMLRTLKEDLASLRPGLLSSASGTGFPWTKRHSSFAAPAAAATASACAP